MNVMVTMEQRYYSDQNGLIWTPCAHDYQFFTRYLEIFEHVSVLARLKPVDTVPTGWKCANGPGVSFIGVPYFVGPMEYALRSWQVYRAVYRAVQSIDAAILRVPSTIADVAQMVLTRCGRPYALEVIGDPYDVFAPGAVRHPLRRVFRLIYPYQLRRQCRNAYAVTYVTKQALQSRYPAGGGAFQSSYSDVELGDDAFSSARKPSDYRKTRLTLIHVGMLEQLYKAPDVLIEALAICIQAGLPLRLVFVGDGKYRRHLEGLAAKLDVLERITFTGSLPNGQAIRHELDKADVFVLASRVEGLPRAMIEAMARGLPCIGSTVGGIPELLEPEDMVNSVNAAALSRKIRDIVTDPERLARMSSRNVEKAKAYDEAYLHEARLGFYRFVRERAEDWQKAVVPSPAA